MRLLHAQKHLGFGKVIYWTITQSPFPNAIKKKWGWFVVFRGLSLHNPDILVLIPVFIKSNTSLFNSPHKVLLIGLVLSRRMHIMAPFLCVIHECKGHTTCWQVCARKEIKKEHFCVLEQRKQSGMDIAVVKEGLSRSSAIEQTCHPVNLWLSISKKDIEQNWLWQPEAIMEAMQVTFNL